MKRTLVIALLVVVGISVYAPAPAQAQSQEDFDCLVDALGSPTTLPDDLQACVEALFPGSGHAYCDNCDPKFDFEKIREAILEFNQGRALRQRLLECRNRRLNETHSVASRRECGSLEQFFELYINDENSLEARRR